VKKCSESRHDEGKTIFPPNVLILFSRNRIVKQKSVKELNVQLESLVGTNSTELLVGALRSRKSISGPELTK
jgi:hypothetical protein